MATTQPLRVAIIGGGLAGSTLLNILLKKPALSVQIYESKPEFSERGAAVGLSSDTQEALKKMDPNFLELLNGAGATPMNLSRLGSGPHAGEALLDLASDKLTLVVHRAALLNALLKDIPRDIMHANKRLAKIEEPGKAQGAGQALEDVMILVTLFKEIKNSSQIPAALKVFDEIRRPRSQRIVASSVKTGTIMCGRDPEIDLYPQKMREAMGPRWEFIFGLDMKEHKKDALLKFKGNLR